MCDLLDVCGVKQVLNESSSEIHCLQDDLPDNTLGSCMAKRVTLRNLEGLRGRDGLTADFNVEIPAGSESGLHLWA